MRKNARNLLLQGLVAVLVATGAFGAVSMTGDEANATSTVRGASHATAAAKARAWPLLKTGSQGANVRTAQHLLAARGHHVAVDSVFGEKTADAVRAFQARAHLTVDGVVGPRTWGKLITTVRSNSRGPAVRAAQVQLGVTTDGVFGQNTRKAVRAFQTRAGLTVDGIVGPKTWNAMLAGPSAVPAPGSPKPAPRGYYLQFAKNWKSPANSRLTLVRDGKVIDSYRAGSGLGSTNECAKAKGWLPSGTYPITAHLTNKSGSVIQGYAIQLADKTCKPKAGQKAVKRTELFIHSEMTKSGSQGKDSRGDDGDRWENDNDYKSLGCIKLHPNDIKDLFRHIDAHSWKNLTLRVG